MPKILLIKKKKYKGLGYTHFQEANVTKEFCFFCYCAQESSAQEVIIFIILDTAMAGHIDIFCCNI